MRRVRIPHSDGHCFSSGVRTRLPVADVQLSSVGRLKGGVGQQVGAEPGSAEGGVGHQAGTE